MGLYNNIVQWDWNLEERPENHGATGPLPPFPPPYPPPPIDGHVPPPEHPTVGEFVSYIKYPFGEYNLDPIFRIKQLYNNFTADIEVLYSSRIPLGTIYLKQSLDGLRRVKLSTIEEVTSSAYSASTISPQPVPIKILKYNLKV